ncbi:MAG: hypothetical protein U0441_11635 [Polyangiaceae bacterium]
MPLARTPSFHRITLLLGALFLARAVNGCAESPASADASPARVASFTAASAHQVAR